MRWDCTVFPPTSMRCAVIPAPWILCACGAPGRMPAAASPPFAKSPASRRVYSLPRVFARRRFGRGMTCADAVLLPILLVRRRGHGWLGRSAPAPAAQRLQHPGLGKTQRRTPAARTTGRTSTPTPAAARPVRSLHLAGHRIRVLREFASAAFAVGLPFAVSRHLFRVDSSGWRCGPSLLLGA